MSVGEVEGLTHTATVEVEDYDRAEKHGEVTTSTSSEVVEQDHRQGPAL
jgi:hypothetical protein